LRRFRRTDALRLAGYVYDDLDAFAKRLTAGSRTRRDGCITRHVLGGDSSMTGTCRVAT